MAREGKDKVRRTVLFTLFLGRHTECSFSSSSFSFLLSEQHRLSSQLGRHVKCLKAQAEVQYHCCWEG